MQEKLLSVTDIARMTQRHVVTVHQWIRAKLLPAQLIGQSFVITQSDFETFLENRKKRGVPAKWKFAKD